MAFSDLFARLKRADPEVDTGVVAMPVSPTKALTRFVSALSGRAAPVLLDLGPVIGSNVSFFGEELGCKILVEDLAKDIDRHVSEQRTAELPAFMETRLAREDQSVDGVLCWDMLDYLDKAGAAALARQIVRVLKPDGVVLAFFNTHEQRHGAPDPPATYIKHIVVDRANLQYRSYPAARGKQKPHQNRDIQRMFEPLRTTDQFLMKSYMREVVLRKPMPTAAVAPEAAPESGAATPEDVPVTAPTTEPEAS